MIVFEINKKLIEKIFDDQYGKKLGGQQTKHHQFPVIKDRPEISRLTTVAPDQPPSTDRDQDQIAVVSPGDNNE